MSDTTFELAESDTLKKIGELTQAKGRSLSLSLNHAGAFQMNLPLVGDLSTRVEEIVTCVLIKQKQKIVWSGPVWTTSESTPDTLNVSCVGWLQTLEKRVSKYAWGNPLGYVDIEAGDIAIDLLTRSNEDNTVGQNYVVPGSVENTQIRTRSYPPFSNVLNEITALTEIESGFDMHVDPLTRELNIYARIGEQQPQSYFEYGGNAADVTRTCDAARMCNRFIAYGPTGWAQSDDLQSIATYGLFEEAVSLADVRDINILQAYADAEVGVRGLPLRFHSFTPMAPSDATGNVPRLFWDFKIGDTVYIKANRGRLIVPKQEVRIFGASISWEDTGQERLTSIQTTVSG